MYFGAGSDLVCPLRARRSQVDGIQGEAYGYLAPLAWAAANGHPVVAEAVIRRRADPRQVRGGAVWRFRWRVGCRT